MSRSSIRKTGFLYGFFISAPQEHLGFELDSIDGFGHFDFAAAIPILALVTLAFGHPHRPPRKSAHVGWPLHFTRLIDRSGNVFTGCVLHQAGRSGRPKDVSRRAPRNGRFHPEWRSF